MFRLGKRRREQEQQFQAYVTEERRLRIVMARAIATEQLTGERQESALARIAAVEQQEHEGEYFCGVCGWMPISRFPNCHE